MSVYENVAVAPAPPTAPTTETVDDAPVAVVNETPEEAAAVARREALPFLYDSATALEMDLRRVSHANVEAELTAAQIGVYNQLLDDARQALPNSKALSEDMRDITGDDRAGNVYHAVHTTLVPTLRNALPEDDYDKR